MMDNMSRKDRNCVDTVQLIVLAIRFQDYTDSRTSTVKALRNKDFRGIS